MDPDLDMVQQQHQQSQQKLLQMYTFNMSEQIVVRKMYATENDTVYALNRDDRVSTNNFMPVLLYI